MGRGRNWTSIECAHFCEAWLFAMNDPIAGVDQTGSRFWRTTADKFVLLNSRNADSHGRYISRLGINEDEKCEYDFKLIKKQFAEVSKQVQRYSVALRRVYASKPAGSVKRTQIHAMACAIHLGRTDKMEYRFIDDLPREQWPMYDSFVVLQESPKFCIEGTAADSTPEVFNSSPSLPSLDSGPSRVGTNSSITSNVRRDCDNVLEAEKGSGCSRRRGEAVEEGTDGGGVLGNADGIERAESDRGGSTGRKRKRDLTAPIGRKAAKDVRSNQLQEQQRTAIDKRIAASMEIKAADARVRTAMLSDTNMLLAYGTALLGETAEDIRDRLELMRMYRKTKLADMKAKIALHTGPVNGSEDVADSHDDRYE
ncbi:unnamed protein product [Chondrus crispus]|uniref:No apical meristem-associated C-terminal domain-containing protein n=1 Tax=Chondrus crispus TaxID=2769 RepID=R7Q9M1_CHOCR|nr:unnamed protein product [Chondrus crispus]CDF34175.1 unnamed protein product [Chondrus crispus]|eukprot:XP_005713994.1 unnamed protein product [Chondrus crispus]